MKNAQAKNLPTHVALVNEFCQLHEELKPYQAKIRRADELKKLLADVAGLEDPEGIADVTLQGDGCFATFSKPSVSRSVPAERLPLLHEIVGLPTLLRVVKVSVSALDPLLSPLEAAQVFVTGAGPRRLKDCGMQHSELFGDLKGALRLVK